MQTDELRTSLVYEVRVFVKDPTDELRLGMPATVHLPLDKSDAPTAGRQVMSLAGDHRPVVFGRGRSQDVSARHRRSRPALDGVSFEARRGMLTALVGPDGAGKTTLLRLAAGLLTADAGELQVLGIDVAADPQQVQERIGYMPQTFGLYEDLTVQENLDLYADLHGVTAAKRRDQLSAASWR